MAGTEMKLRFFQRESSIFNSNQMFLNLSLLQSTEVTTEDKNLWKKFRKLEHLFEKKL